MTVMPPPFVVMTMPRSRSFWLSKFLAPRGWTCGHDSLRYMRNLDDGRRWLAQPWTGTCETGIAPWWRALQRLRPDCAVVVVRRDPREVIESLVRLGLFPESETLWRQCYRMAAKLDQIALRWPGALVVDYQDLVLEDCCAEVFEHCLGGLEHDPTWWQWHHQTNLQGDVLGILRYLVAYAEPIQAAIAGAKQAELGAMERRPKNQSLYGYTVQLEPLASLRRDGAAVFALHCIQAGLAPGAWQATNWSLYQGLEDQGNLQCLLARDSSGGLIGYLLTVIGPSFDDTRVRQATHTMQWTDPMWPGLGRRMAREAVALLVGKANEVIWQPGELADGPRFGLLAKRLGAKPDGQLWRLELGSGGPG